MVTRSNNNDNNKYNINIIIIGYLCIEVNSYKCLPISYMSLRLARFLGDVVSSVID